MLNENNIAVLKTQLLSLGFLSGLEHELRATICLQPEQFDVAYRQMKEGDTMNISLHFQQTSNEEGYGCGYYDACLRKKIEIPVVNLNEVNAKALEERMSKVKWEGAKTRTESDSSWAREEAIESIITDLRKLALTTEGLVLADRLKMKFWADTGLESHISNLNAQKSQFEISQRFYFFDGEDQITLDEAYRFLCHRWREKQLNARKKQGEPVAQSENGSSAGGAIKENKLLPKKRRGRGSKFRL